MSRRAWAAYRSDGVPCPDNHPSPAHAEACLRFRRKVERRERGDDLGPWAGGRVDEVITVVEPEPWPVGCQVLTVIAVVLVVWGWMSTT